MRKLEFTVGIDSISPDTAQFGGIQGEHNATEIEITLTDELVLALKGALNLVYYRIDLVDGAGTHYIGEPKVFTGENSLIYKIPQAATAQGGNGEVRLVFSEMVDSETVKLVYTFGMRLYFEPSFHGDEAEIKAVEDLSGLVEKASDCAERAERSAVLAQNASYLAGQSVEEINEIIFDTLDNLKESGEFDGKDGTPATHSWNGTVLTITSASGTSSADLKGEKGDKGEKGEAGSTGPRGEKGDKGDAYILTDADKSEIATRVNAVSYSDEQPLTDEQKEIARQNIGVFSQNQVAEMVNYSFGQAVPKTDVVDNLVANNQFLTDKIPNGNAIQTFIENNAVSSAKTQSLSDSKKARARANIGAISQTELDEAVANVGGGSSEEWETIADITLEEASAAVNISQDIDGQAFSLKKAKIIVDTDNTSGFYTATGNLLLVLHSAETNGFARAIYLTSFLPNTAGKYSRAIFEVEVVDGMAFVSGRHKSNISALKNSEFGSPFTISGNLAFALKNSIVDNMQIHTNISSGFAIGTRVKILGVRA